uniref:Putative ABC transport system ATP-binding protein n=1 Tax=Candidatus Kentrum sp. TUN TaxID=2126343 RepID=A0A450ZFE2_9GAMM|nr:MAG: putative ABC transport system ATP-binding protein [Candidatus Kentron sp. TUN]VFK52467.1 MAG: putative ABC transport system ATP-binding protein [Candidatus Kentron sp. TUN]VFK57981.1 MAG: putative ABC transport system ATP-binding protein [Candidatus Kentron sp. TUN]
MLEAIGIRREAGNRRLLDDISFSIHAGQRLALIGPSGSGKTLLLRALAMLDLLDAGEVRWHGKIVSGNEIPRFRSRVMFLPQQPMLPEGTVEEILRQPFSLKVHHEKRFDRTRIVALLASLGQSDGFLSKQQTDLSGGQTQLTALLRAIQLDPDILLLDEPTAALDSETVGMVESLVAAWFQRQPNQSRTIVWVTHDHEQIPRVSTSILHVRDGRLVISG